jgi:hypothetical protein
MHDFAELVNKCATFTLTVLSAANKKTIKNLQARSATSLVKTLQMIELQKAILAVGMFSLFEASLQNCLKCKDGFSTAKNILEKVGRVDLKSTFEDLCLAINVLKHGQGRSYDALIFKANTLPFRVRLPEETFFFEGDVSEISTLVEVDDAFVQYCCGIIYEVLLVIRQQRQDFFL